MNALRLYPIAVAAAALAAGAVAYVLRGRKKTPEQRERERRERISLSGRITDGTIVDVQELHDSERTAQFLVYQYGVAGVQYECSQEVSYLRDLVDIYNCKLGLPASIKYDPQNPGNSIVISELWSGIRK